MVWRLPLEFDYKDTILVLNENDNEFKYNTQKATNFQEGVGGFPKAISIEMDDKDEKSSENN